MMQHQLRSEETSEDDGGGRNYGSAMIPLGEDFEPGDDDVLVGRYVIKWSMGCLTSLLCAV